MSRDDLQAFNLSDRSGVLPASYRIVGPDAQTPGSQQVVEAHADVINQFVARQRQAYALSGNEHQRGSYASDDLDIRYHNLNGQERIELEPRVQQPEPPSQPPQPEPDDPILVGPVDEEIDVSFPCMLVLYKNNHFAAISMGSLSGEGEPKPALVFALKDNNSSFQQPVKTGQYTFGSVSFIHTDVDLKGKQQSRNGDGIASCICTTRMIDSKGLSSQYIPIFNSDKQRDDTVQGGDTITLYTSDGSYDYESGKFTQKDKGIKLVNQSPAQPAAIDTDGTMYFGGDFESAQAAVRMYGTTVDSKNTDLLQALVDAELAIDSFVMAYTVNYIRWLDGTGKEQYNASYKSIVDADYGGFASDPLLHGKNIIYAEDSEFLSTDYNIEYIFEIATAVPSGQFVGTKNENLYLTTEVVGLHFYATAKPGDTEMKLDPKNITLAYDNVYYYTFNIDTNYYENLKKDKVNKDFTGDFVRMTYSKDDGLELYKYNMKATANTDYSFGYEGIQDFPEWGGYLILGLTVDAPPVVLFPPDCPDLTVRNQIQERHSFSKQRTSHSTIIPSHNKGFINNTYVEAVQYDSDIIEEMSGYLAGVKNCEDGGTRSFQGTTLHMYTERKTGSFEPNPYTGRMMSVETVNDFTSDSGTGANAKPPGYKAQLINSIYEAHIEFLDEDVKGYSSTIYQGLHEVTDTYSDYRVAEIEMLPFPPTAKDKAFYKKVAAQGKQDGMYSYVTPYGLQGEKQPSSDQPTLTGWLHVTNDDLELVGWIVETQQDGKKPYIYLNGKDLLTPLAKVLQCDASDVAACYFDIDLAAIKLLGNVS